MRPLLVPSSMSLAAGLSSGHGHGFSGSAFRGRSWVLVALLSALVGSLLAWGVSSTPLAVAAPPPQVSPDVLATSMPEETPLPSMTSTPSVTEMLPSAQEVVPDADHSVPAGDPSASVSPDTGVSVQSLSDPAELPQGWDHPEVVEYRYAVFFALCAIAMLSGVGVVSGFRR